MLTLDSSTRRILTKQQTDNKAVPVDLDGNPIVSSTLPFEVYDGNDGRSYVRLVAQLPTLTDDKSEQLRADLVARSPFFINHEDTRVRGYFVAFPGFDVAPAPSKAPSPAPDPSKPVFPVTYPA